MALPERVSLQDIVRRRQQAGFVGRDGQLALFRENLDLPADDDRKRFVFNIRGDAGFGKTYLVRQLQRVARERGTRDALYEDTLADCTRALGPDNPLTTTVRSRLLRRNS